MNTEDYATAHAFVWFTGVVEDILDPEQLGRVKVRCFGYHTGDMNEISTPDLPWATVMLPNTSASMTGIGRSATGLLQGSWVIGFFRDGTSAQDPIVIGSVPSRTTQKITNESSGYRDPTNQYPLDAEIGNSDMPDESRTEFQESYGYVTKQTLRDEYVEIPTSDTAVPGGNTGESWSLTDVGEIVNPVYPKNHTSAFEDDSNVIEHDSTIGFHRYSHVGPNKTFTEIDKDGNETQVITGKRYQVIANGDNVYIKGGCNLTIEGGCRTLVDGDWHIQVTGNLYKYVHGNEQIKINKLKKEVIGDSLRQEIGTTMYQSAGGAVTEEYASTQITDVTGAVTYKGSTISLNPPS